MKALQTIINSKKKEMKKYKKPAESLRTEIVNLRLTTIQKKQLEYNATQLGMSLSSLIRTFLPLNEKR